MTPAELKALILAQPADGPVRAAYAAGRDADCSDLLNARSLPGYVPARDAVAALVRRNLWGVAALAFRFRLLPNGSACPNDLFGLFSTVEVAAFATIEPPIRLEVSPLTDALNQLVTAGLFTADDRAAVLADAKPISVVEQAAGYGATVSAADVRAASRED